VELPQPCPQRGPVDIARLDYNVSLAVHGVEKRSKFVQDCIGIVRDAVANRTVILDVSKDLVASGVGVVGRGTLMPDLLKPVGFIGVRTSSTWRAFRIKSCNVS